MLCQDSPWLGNHLGTFGASDLTMLLLRDKYTVLIPGNPYGGRTMPKSFTGRAFPSCANTTGEWKAIQNLSSVRI